MSLLNRKKCLEKYSSDYKINQLIKSGKLFKLASGVYSDKKLVSELEIIAFKYSKAIFTMDSAFYYHNLTDSIPEKYYLATDRDATKIKDKKIKQVFVDKNILNLGVEEIEYQGVKIKIYNKARMLIELVRNKSKLPYDYYKEIINNFRKDVEELYLFNEYINKFPKKKKIIKLLQDEVF